MLSYLRKAQIRASDYFRLEVLLGDSRMMEEEANVVRTGRLFIFPSTHVGEERCMVDEMNDTVAICNAIGNPDFFFAIIGNPNSLEIITALLFG